MNTNLNLKPFEILSNKNIEDKLLNHTIGREVFRDNLFDLEDNFLLRNNAFFIERHYPETFRDTLETTYYLEIFNDIDNVEVIEGGVAIVERLRRAPFNLKIPDCTDTELLYLLDSCLLGLETTRYYQDDDSTIDFTFWSIFGQKHYYVVSFMKNGESSALPNELMCLFSTLKRQSGLIGFIESGMVKKLMENNPTLNVEDIDSENVKLFLKYFKGETEWVFEYDSD